MTRNTGLLGCSDQRRGERQLPSVTQPPTVADTVKFASANSVLRWNDFIIGTITIRTWREFAYGTEQLCPTAYSCFGS